MPLRNPSLQVESSFQIPPTCLPHPFAANRRLLSAVKTNKEQRGRGSITISPGVPQTRSGHRPGRRTHRPGARAEAPLGRISGGGFRGSQESRGRSSIITMIRLSDSLNNLLSGPSSVCCSQSDPSVPPHISVESR